MGEYLRLIIHDVGELALYLNDDTFIEKLKPLLPLKSLGEVWKEELYFECGVDYNPKSGWSSKVVRNSLSYWRPGSALCLFYGLSQPYGEVYSLGYILGPTGNLLDLENGDRYPIFLEKADRNMDEDLSLRSLDKYFPVYRRTDDGAILSSIDCNILNLGVEIYEEDYGFILESDVLTYPSWGIPPSELRRSLSEKISDTRLRLDLNEDGDLILSSYVADERQLLEVLHRIQKICREVYTPWL